MRTYGIAQEVIPYIARGRLGSTPMLSQAAIERELSGASRQVESRALPHGYLMPQGHPQSPRTQRDWLLNFLVVESVAATLQLRLAPDIDPAYIPLARAYMARISRALRYLGGGELGAAWRFNIPMIQLCDTDSITDRLPGYGINDDPSPSVPEITDMISRASALMLPFLVERGVDIAALNPEQADLIAGPIADWVTSVCLRARAWDDSGSPGIGAEALRQDAERYESSGTEVFDEIRGGEHDWLLCGVTTIMG